MLRYFFLILLCYFGVRFLFGFVIPVVTTALQMRKKMKEMHRATGDETSFAPNTASNTKPTTTKSDYIDFEEIK